MQNHLHDSEDARVVGCDEDVLTRRDVVFHEGGSPNKHCKWYTVRKEQDGILFGAIRIMFNFVVIQSMRYSPSFYVKRQVFNRLLGMKLGRNVSVSPGVILDFFFPELIEIGDNTIVGLNATILTHEFFHDGFRTGPTKIGGGVMIGARSLILCGVTVGDGAIISAMSLVNRGVPARANVRGNPIELVSFNPRS